MSRRTTAKKRLVSPDPIYRSRLVSMILSRLLQDGKKSIARRIFYESMETLEQLSRTSMPVSRSENAGAGAKPIREANQPMGSTESSMREAQHRTTGAVRNRVGAMPSIELDSRSESILESTESANAEKVSLKVFQQAVLNVTPVVEVKSRRVGGSNYQVPLEVNAERGTSLALRWIVQSARQRPGREMATKLANELLDASNKTGNAIRKREETHRMAEANKAFANYRF